MGGNWRRQSKQTTCIRGHQPGCRKRRCCSDALCTKSGYRLNCTGSPGCRYSHVMRLLVHDDVPEWVTLLPVAILRVALVPKWTPAQHTRLRHAQSWSKALGTSCQLLRGLVHGLGLPVNRTVPKRMPHWILCQQRQQHTAHVRVSWQQYGSTD